MSRARLACLIASSLAVASGAACGLDVRLGGAAIDAGEPDGTLDAPDDVRDAFASADGDAVATTDGASDAASDGADDAPTDAIDAADASDASDAGDAGDGADAFDAGDASDAADANDADAALVCAPPLADCDGLPGNGCEINLSNDGTHCGRCDRNCLGATCVSGQCSAVTVAQSILGPTWLAVDAQSVFVTTRGHAGTVADPNEVLRIDLPASAPVKIADGAGQFEGIALGAPLVFYVRHAAAPTETDVRRNDRTGALASFAVVAQNAVSDGLGIAVDGTDVYWAAGTSLYRATTSTVSVTGTAFAQPFTRPYGVATDATRVYVTDETAGTLSFVDRATGTVTTYVVGGTPRGIAVDATHVYTAAGDRLVRVVKATGVVEPLESGLVNATDIAQDGVRLFFGSGTQVLTRLKFTMGRVPLAAGTFSSVGHLATDAAYVYFTDPVGGKVYRVAK